MTPATPVLLARAISAAYGSGELCTRVLDGVDLDLAAGELVLLMGPSGSGKTTLLSIVAGLLRPTSGTVELCGQHLERLTEPALAELRRTRVGFVFQTHNLFPALDAVENVALSFRFRGASRREARGRAADILAEVGLGDRLHHLPHELSGGQRQRVAIARALAGDPPVLFGDEITASLDGAGALAVLGVLRARLGPGTAALLVTHDPRLIPFASRVVELEGGRATAGAPSAARAPEVVAGGCQSPSVKNRQND